MLASSDQRIRAAGAPLVEVAGVSFHYARRAPGTLAVLTDISFDVGPAQVLSIVGPSGCGKTSLLNCVAGLQSGFEGTIRVVGQPPQTRSRACAVVFQNPSLFPWKTVLRNVAYGLDLQHVAKAEANSRAFELLRMTGLQEFADYYPHQLSGGMQQRVNLARALVMRPKVLLLDEPFAALDAITRELMQEELSRLLLETETSAILITHQIDEALYLGDDVAVMTGRPGTIKRSIHTPWPRPRTHDLKRDPRFVEQIDEIWHLIDKDPMTGSMSDDAGERGAGPSTIRAALRRRLRVPVTRGRVG